jgi:beta-glucosidase-like glycosyl hydrolase
VLRAKYKYGLADWKMVNTNNLWQDLNSNSAAIRREVSQNALTLLRNDDNLGFPIQPNNNAKIAFLGLGLKKDNAFAKGCAVITMPTYSCSTITMMLSAFPAWFNC